MKMFNIDGINVEIDDKLFNEACRVYVLEDEDNMYVSDTVEECRRSNYLYLRNAIEAGYTPTLDDLGKVSLNDIRSKYSNKEISLVVDEMIRQSVKTNGGNYNI